MNGSVSFPWEESSPLVEEMLPQGESGDEDCSGSWILWLSFLLRKGYEKLYDVSIIKTRRKLKFTSEEDNGDQSHLE